MHACAAGLLALAACDAEAPARQQTLYPTAGLYTPGSLLGASDPSDTPTPGAGLGNRCVALGTPEGVAATTGKLTVRYKTRSLDGRYAPKNCTATWIETADERYVATIEVTAALRRPGLVYWQDHACPEKTGPDVVTSATLTDHEKEHVATWNGLDLDGKPVLDGDYVLYVEVTESDKEPGELTSFPFTRGPLPFAGPQAVDVEGPILELSLEWVPEMGGAAGAGP
jgi:hypothetical protein